MRTTRSCSGPAYCCRNWHSTASLAHGTRKELPLALITGPAQRRVLLDANAAARAAGLYPGQPLLAAQALLQDFQAIDHDPREDERLRRFLAAWAYRYSSMVSLEGEDAIVLEVERSLGLFGPWPRLERMLRDDLRELGFQHRIAMAPTALGACVLAAAQDGLALTETPHLRHSAGTRVDHTGSASANETRPRWPRWACASCGNCSPCRAPGWRGASVRACWNIWTA